MKISTAQKNDFVYDIARIREDFPILAKPVHGKPLVYLDNGASAQKPRIVIDRMRQVYEESYANIHRGSYYLSEQSTALYEGSRDRVQRFLNAARRSEIVFTKNATEAINLVAYSYGSSLRPGDEIIISALEHHSNIVPWQLLRDRQGVTLKVVPITDEGEFLIEDFKNLLSERTKIVAVAHASNVLGTVTPLAEIIRLSHQVGAKVLVDGSQAVMHMPIDVQVLDPDFYVFTGHKIYGPSGIGVLYGKEAVLDKMPPFLGGGDMIATVSFEKSTWADLPAKFEAGTPPIVEAIGLAAAIDYVSELGLDHIARHEADLLAYATQRLASIEGLKFVGTAPRKTAIISFHLEGAHPHDVATIIDREGVAIRAGNHCAQPLMDRLGLPGTARASFGLYNTRTEADRLVMALEKVREIFR